MEVRRQEMSADLDAARFFDSFAAAFDTLYDGKRNAAMQWVDRKFRSDMFIRFALTFERLGALAGKSVLDVGCGSGPYVLEALQRGATHVTALDPAPNMLALARERIASTPHAGKCSFVQAMFPTGSLTPHDHAIVMGVMDYVPEPQKFLDALRPLVKQSAVLSFPSRHWFRTPFRKFRYTLRRCPVYFYDPEGIRALAARAGFRGVEIYKIPGAGMDYHVWLKA